MITDAASTISRVDAIQTMIAQLVVGPSPATAPSGATPSSTTTATPASFAATLQTATAATATPATATTAAPVATTASAPVATTTAATTTAATPTTGAATGSALPADVPYGAQITAAAQRYGLDPALLAGLIKQESGFDPTARSSAGAVGLTQLMPGTAASLGVTDATDPAQAIDGGAHYLSEQLQAFNGDPAKALAAYNAGPGAVTQYGGVPPYTETQNYVKDVLAFANQYRGATTSA